MNVDEANNEAGVIKHRELLIRLEDEAGKQVVALYGELDLATAAAFVSTLRSVEATRPSEIIIDLSGLDFVDSTGLAVLIDVAERSRNDGDRLGFLRGPRNVHQLFVSTGAAEHLPFVD